MSPLKAHPSENGFENGLGKKREDETRAFTMADEPISKKPRYEKGRSAPGNRARGIEAESRPGAGQTGLI